MPAWLLRNGRINAAESELEAASSSCEWWSIGCGVLVVVSVIVELVIAWIEPPYILFLKVSVYPDAAIAIGIVGEVLFGMWDSRIQTELRTRSNDRLKEAEISLAGAIDRATELERQLQPRMLSKEQYDAIQALKGQVETVVIAPFNGTEPRRFASQIGTALADAGIDARMAQPRIGMSWTSLYVVMPEAEADLSQNIFFKAFTMAGLSVGVGNRSQVSLGDIPEDLPVIMVGEKPFEYPRPPLVWPPEPENTQSSEATETSAKREPSI